MTVLVRHNFDDRGTLAERLADKVAAQLDAAIAARARATLAVSGGATPRRFFQALSVRQIAWDKVTVTLVDERFAPETSERSNQRLVVERLLRNKAARAAFVPLYNAAPDAVKAADRAAAVIAGLPRPFDVVVLGMGADGHTASFFPGGDRLSEALSEAPGQTVVPMDAPGAGESRLTLRWPVFADARLLVLHIEGADKAAVLKRAEGDGPEGEMPVRAVLRRAQTPVEIYWAP